MAVTTFCAQSDVERLLSSQGALDAADHDEDGAADTSVITDCIEQASQEVSLYANRWHTDAQLATSALVTRWTTTLAAFFLTQRRGNPVPDSLAVEFARLTAPPDGMLLKIADGKFQVPGLAMRSGVTPQFSNLQVDRRYARDKLRVVGGGSIDESSAIEQHSAFDLPEVL